MRFKVVIGLSLLFLMLAKTSNADADDMLVERANADEIKLMVNNGEIFLPLNNYEINIIEQHGTDDLLYEITKKELINENKLVSFSSVEETPTVSIVESSPDALEGNSGSSTIEFHISLSSVSSETVSVVFFTKDSSATSGEDYEGIETDVIFSPGETSKVVQVDIFGDTKYEIDELFRSELKNPVNAELDLSGSVIKGYESIAKIINDDLPDLPISGINAAIINLLLD
jgi:hypothetical protein